MIIPTTGGILEMVYTLVGIVGSRNTGKTTTTTNLTNFFVNQGLKTAIIKFMQHKFNIDPSHKDSASLRRTKATTIISTSPYETVLFQKTEQRSDLQTLLQHIPPGIDIVFCESYPSKFPSIPLIFTCKNIADFYETKKRYNYQNPLFITGIITNENFNTLEGIPVLSNIESVQLQQAFELILKIQVDKEISL
ncbi:MAG: molybdopterin-guanine dinucleotide biosynthesis protein MobB [Promethearchaeota archaeon]